MASVVEVAWIALRVSFVNHEDPERVVSRAGENDERVKRQGVVLKLGLMNLWRSKESEMEEDEEEEE